jgi:hypothetical protein
MLLRDFTAVAGLVFLTGLVLNALWIALLALPFSWLWNWTLVSLMHAPVLDYEHAVGLLLLCLILHLVSDGVKLSASARDSKQQQRQCGSE